MKPIRIALLLIMICLTTQAQKFELGKVTIEELQQKEHPKDPSAAAAVLFERGETYFVYSENIGFTILTEIEVKIKVYKKEGYEWANKSVLYYIENNPSEKVTFSKATTYNLVDGKIEKTKLKSDGEFVEQHNKYWASRKITMPNVKEGSILEYKYIIESPYETTFPEWSFQRTIPVNYSEYKTVVPEYFTYSPFFKGFISPTVTKVAENKSIIISSKEDNGFGKASTFSNDKIDYVANKTTYVVKDAPAMKDEAFVNNITNYISSIAHELSMKKFPNSLPKMYSTDWNAVVKTIYDNDQFGSELKKTNYFEDDVNAIIAGVSSKSEKMALVFEYVKSRMNWNNFLGYYCSDGVKSAYKNKTGNIAEINLMLTAMLRHAGLNAMPVLVSTRSNGIAFFPNRSAYNYVITAVEDNGSVTLLDATSKYTQPNILPFRALNWIGKIIREDGSSQTIDLMPASISKEQTSMNYAILADGSVKGKIRKMYTDYNAQIYRQSNLGSKEDEYLEKLENKLNKIEISEYSRTNAEDLKQPVTETFSFVGNNLCDVTADKIYFSPLLFFSLSQNPFTQEKREYPVDFGFPQQDKYTINIEIPEGFAIESTPAPVTIQTEANICGFKYSIMPSGNKIQMVFTHDILLPIVSSNDYQTLKDVFQKLVEKQTEKIVLKKV